AGRHGSVPSASACTKSESSHRRWTKGRIPWARAAKHNRSEPHKEGLGGFCAGPPEAGPDLGAWARAARAPKSSIVLHSDRSDKYMYSSAVDARPSRTTTVQPPI